MPINSGEHQSHRDIVTRRVRVRTRRVRLLDEHIGLGAGKSWETNPEFDLDPESRRCRSHTDAGFDLGIRRERNALLSGDILHDSQKAGRIAGCICMPWISWGSWRSAGRHWRCCEIRHFAPLLHRSCAGR